MSPSDSNSLFLRPIPYSSPSFSTARVSLRRFEAIYRATGPTFAFDSSSLLRSFLVSLALSESRALVSDARLRLVLRLRTARSVIDYQNLSSPSLPLDYDLAELTARRLVPSCSHDDEGSLMSPALSLSVYPTQQSTHKKF